MLLNFSLTRQEAVIYQTLLSEGALSGYEVSKNTGISRSMCYTALASLVEKGASYMVEESSTKYIAVSPEKFCDNRIKYLSTLKKALVDNMIMTKTDEEGYITIKGKQNIVYKITDMINNAKERIYICASNELLTTFGYELGSAVTRGLKVVIMTDRDITIDGSILYLMKSTTNQIRLIVDTTSVLTGEVEVHSSCLYSKKKNLVDLFKETLKNEIRLIELGKL